MDHTHSPIAIPPPAKAPSLHDSARGSPSSAYALDDFSQLVDDINNILGPSSGIDSADVNVEEIQNAMRSYCSIEREWQDYAFADLSRAYTRNLVDAGNGKCNLVSTVPHLPSQESPANSINSYCSSGHPARARLSMITPMRTAS